jgi:hypothetical protein
MLNESRWPFTPSRLRCLVVGHDDAFARGPKRLFLRCDTCGRETPGWTIGPPQAAVRRQAPAMAGMSRAQPAIRTVRPAF